MWYVISSLFSVAFVFCLLGYWLGQRKCMIELSKTIETESDADRNYRIHHGVSYKNPVTFQSGVKDTMRKRMKENGEITVESMGL